MPGETLVYSSATDWREPGHGRSAVVSLALAVLSLPVPFCVWFHGWTSGNGWENRAVSLPAACVGFAAALLAAALPLATRGLRARRRSLAVAGVGVAVLSSLLHAFVLYSIFYDVL